jgi:hypothetical protein
LALRRIYDFTIYRRLQHTIQRQNMLVMANAHRLRIQQASLFAKPPGKKIKWSQIIKQQNRIVEVSKLYQQQHSLIYKYDNSSMLKSFYVCLR